MTINIFVNQTCINESRRIIPRKGDRGKNCPVGLALQNAGVEFRTVGTGWVSLGKSDESIQEQLPPLVTSFIEDFDRGKPVAPFRFNLEIPDAFVRLDSQSLLISDDHPRSHGLTE